MYILAELKKISVFFDNKKNSLFSYPITKQKQYMSRLKKPNNNIERSYNQYCCQMRLRNKVEFFCINIASLPLLIAYYLKKSDDISNLEKSDAVFMADGIPQNVIPSEVKNEFKKWTIVNAHKENFTNLDKVFIKNIIKNYPFSWHFLLKCLIKIRFYSYEIKAHRPEAIVVCGEYSFTSSVLTEYCKINGILHIDVMHGEKLFFMRDSFFNFDRCYVWNQFYIELFSELYANKQQFVIAVPDSMKIETSDSARQIIDYTYYLGGETQVILNKISNCLEKLREKGYRVAVRPHPRYSNINVIKKIFQGYEIEDLNEIDIKTSLMRTKNIVSLYSTVLNQACQMEKNIVLDDVTDPSKYYKLKELHYIVLNYEHGLLSQVMKD